MIPLAVEAAVALIELASQLVPHIVAAIESKGDLTPEQRAALVARVEAARVKVAAYVPRDV